MATDGNRLQSTHRFTTPNASPDSNLAGRPTPSRFAPSKGLPQFHRPTSAARAAVARRTRPCIPTSSASNTARVSRGLVLADFNVLSLSRRRYQFSVPTSAAQPARQPAKKVGEVLRMRAVTLAASARPAADALRFATSNAQGKSSARPGAGSTQRPPQRGPRPACCFARRLPPSPRAAPG
jgi:hypothetical protein